MSMRRVGSDGNGTQGMLSRTRQVVGKTRVVGGAARPIASHRGRAAPGGSNTSKERAPRIADLAR